MIGKYMTCTVRVQCNKCRKNKHRKKEYSSNHVRSAPVGISPYHIQTHSFWRNEPFRDDIYSQVL